MLFLEFKFSILFFAYEYDIVKLVIHQCALKLKQFIFFFIIFIQIACKL